MLEKIDIHLVDHCNLKCKGCTHFSSIAEEFFIDINDFEKDLKRLSSISQGKIGQIYLLGGEPLLHPNVTDFFPITRNLFRESEIIVITNGILLNQQEDKFWNACRHSDIRIWVSAYGLEIDYPSIDQKAAQFGVRLGYTSTQLDEQGQKVWSKYKLDLEGKQHWVESFERCGVRNCVTLKKGKLYTCCILAHIEHFNKQFNANLEVSEFDYIDIYKVNSYNAILHSMVKPIPFCRYCKPQENERGVWEPTKKDISEWS